MGIEINRELEIQVFDQLMADFINDTKGEGGYSEIESPFEKIFFVWLAMHEMRQKMNKNGTYTFFKIIPQCHLNDNGEIYEPNTWDINNTKFVVDFFIETIGFYYDPSKHLKIAVEIEGNGSIANPSDTTEENPELDAFLKKHDILIARFSEAEILNDPQNVILELEELYWGLENVYLKSKKKINLDT